MSKKRGIMAGVRRGLNDVDRLDKEITRKEKEFNAYPKYVCPGLKKRIRVVKGRHYVEPVKHAGGE